MTSTDRRILAAATLPDWPRRLAAQELGLIVTAMMQQALRLADDPAMQAEAPEQTAVIQRRRTAGRLARSSARLAR